MRYMNLFYLLTYMIRISDILCQMIQPANNVSWCCVQVSVIGGVPVMLKTSDMSNTIPDEKAVITYLSYLCARLLSIRNEQRAATVIQMAWRCYRARCQPTVSS